MTIHPMTVDDKTFYIIKSKRKNKKYDVFDANYMYVTSFGDLRYSHYYDKFQEYSYLNHHDPHRRQNYKKRAEAIGHLADPTSANYWSYWTHW